MNSFPVGRDDAIISVDGLTKIYGDVPARGQRLDDVGADPGQAGGGGLGEGQVAHVGERGPRQSASASRSSSQARRGSGSSVAARRRVATRSASTRSGATSRR